jgi:putative peptidoglycan lipid II flippase
VRDGRLESLRTDLSSALRSTLLIMVFAVVGLAVLSYSFSSVFGNNYDETSSIAGVYLAFLTGLVPFTIFFVLLRVFYALDRTRAAFIIQVVQTAFYVGGAVLVGALVPKEWVAVGLALVLSAAVGLQGLLSALYLRRALGPLDTWRVLRQVLWFLGAALVAGAVGCGVLVALGGIGAGGFPVESRLSGILTMILVGGLMALVYAALLWVTRNPEMRAFGEPLLRRLRRAS